MGRLPVIPGLRRRLVLVLAVAGCAALLSDGGVALAHETLTASEPADGAVLAEAPERLTLEFSAPPDVDAIDVMLRNVTGAEVVTGEAAADGTALIVGLIEPLPNGVYTLEWSGAFDDGHQVGSTVSFTVRAQQVTSPAGRAAEEDDGATTWPWLLAGAVMAAALVTFVWLRRRAG
jgi:methionine-rich copper-binding protein CopC